MFLKLLFNRAYNKMTRYCVILEGSINFKEENNFLAWKQNIWELTRGFREKTNFSHEKSGSN